MSHRRARQGSCSARCLGHACSRKGRARGASSPRAAWCWGSSRWRWASGVAARFIRYSYSIITNQPNSERRAGRPSRASIHRRIQAGVDALAGVGGLPGPAKAVKIWRDIWFHEAHHSTALEGNTLVLKQVEALLARGEPVGNKELKEYLEVKGYATAATWVYEQARTQQPSHAHLLTLQEVRRVHYEAMTPVWAVAPHPDATPEESPGNFRKHDLHPFASKMRPPTHPLIAAEMQGWLERANRVREGGGFLCERLPELHAGFERGHPFIDG